MRRFRRAAVLLACGLAAFPAAPAAMSQDEEEETAEERAARVAELLQAAASESRKATAPATSSGCPTRPSGMAPAIVSRAACVMAAVMSVSMNPGATQLTVMLREASSRASERVNPSVPAFDAA